MVRLEKLLEGELLVGFIGCWNRLLERSDLGLPVQLGGGGKGVGVGIANRAPPGLGVLEAVVGDISGRDVLMVVLSVVQNLGCHSDGVLGYFLGVFATDKVDAACDSGG